MGTVPLRQLPPTRADHALTKDTGYTPTLADIRNSYDPTDLPRFADIHGGDLTTACYAEFDRWWNPIAAHIEHLEEKLTHLGYWPECETCGCSDAEGCLGGCSWIETDPDGPLLCSTCAEQPEPGNPAGAAS